MPGLLPESLPGPAKIQAQLRGLVDRVRRLERLQVPQTLAVVSSDPRTTSSHTLAPLFSVLPATDLTTVVRVTVLGKFTGPSATVALLNAGGYPMVQTRLRPGEATTLTSPDPAAGACTVAALVPSGTLSLWVLAASAPRYVADDTGP